MRNTGKQILETIRSVQVAAETQFSHAHNLITELARKIHIHREAVNARVDYVEEKMESQLEKLRSDIKALQHSDELLKASLRGAQGELFSLNIQMLDLKRTTNSKKKRKANK